MEAALVTVRLKLFQRYLTEPEMERMRANYGRDMYEWPPLIAALRKAMAASTPAGDPQVQALARR